MMRYTMAKAVAARWAAIAWFSCLLWAAVSPLRSATYIIEHAWGTNQIATCLRRDCSDWLVGLLPTVPPTDLRSRLQKCRRTCTHFWKMSLFP